MAKTIAKKDLYLRYPVTKAWRDLVKGELDRQGWGAQAKLVKFCKSKSNIVAELLGEDGPATSPLVEPVHKYLGWPPPIPPVDALAIGNWVEIYRRATPEKRDLLIEIIELLDGKNGEEARSMLVSMLKLARLRQSA